MQNRIVRKIVSQSVIEYVLLAALTIVALLVINFLPRMRDGAFSNHFNQARQSITGEIQHGND